MNVEKRKTDELKFYPGNPRTMSEDMVHPTQKPVAVMSRGIKNSSLRNQTVLDLFGGSGTTLIACEQLDRICYMMEIDSHYCDVIIDRWEAYTGQKAEKL